MCRWDSTLGSRSWNLNAHIFMYLISGVGSYDAFFHGFLHLLPFGHLTWEARCSSHPLGLSQNRPERSSEQDSPAVSQLFLIECGASFDADAIDVLWRSSPAKMLLWTLHTHICPLPPAEKRRNDEESEGMSCRTDVQVARVRTLQLWPFADERTEMVDFVSDMPLIAISSSEKERHL